MRIILNKVQVPERGTGDAPFLNKPVCTANQRYLCQIQFKREITCFCHLQGMTGKPVSGYISRSFYIIFFHHLCPRAIKDFHKLFCLIHIILRSHFHPLAGQYHSCSQRFGKYEQITRPCTCVGYDLIRMNISDNCQPVLGREIIDGMTSDYPYSCLLCNIRPAFKNFGICFNREF